LIGTGSFLGYARENWEDDRY